MKSIFFSISIFLVGCDTYHYVSTPNYVPVNTEKGKILANISFNYFQLGYTFANHFSVYTAGNKKQNDFSSGIFSDCLIQCGYREKRDKFKEFNLGFSYYSTITNYLSYEILSCMGKGTVHYFNYYQYQDDSPSPMDYSFSFNSKKATFFMQPNISFRYKEYLDLTIFSRLILNRYYDLNSTLNSGNGYYSDAAINDRFFYDKKVVGLYFLEPGIQIRGGINNLKFVFIYSKANNLQSNSLQYRKNNLYLGISLSFDLLKSLNKPSP
ncbi:MAG: hypothetical protein R6W78_01165 [Bacteroidales bacterium]